MPQSKSRKIAILGYRSVGEWRAPRGLLAPEPGLARAPGRRGPGQVGGRCGRPCGGRACRNQPPAAATSILSGDGGEAGPQRGGPGAGRTCLGEAAGAWGGVAGSRGPGVVPAGSPGGGTSPPSLRLSAACCRDRCPQPLRPK